MSHSSTPVRCDDDEQVDPSSQRPIGLIRRLYDRFGELVRFLSVGGTAFLVDVGLFNVFLIGFEWNSGVAKTVSMIIATTGAFLGNRYWTWRHNLAESETSRQAAGQYFLYFFFNGIGLLISLLCLWANFGLAMVWPSHFDTVLAKNIAANVVGVALASGFRFYAYRTWVFSPKRA
ncbi:GtrA family protein [Haloglycomyces albus]|uniref:GtrA family protein n=1 Tax=Haloglycomyces albus TaxID=526067 RepID=UPI00046CEF2C|nr:GtrA family protein [Haloglycomyces albus]